MRRKLMEQLVKWRGSVRRKPLILNGARRVGKTWPLREFGKACFNNVAYVSLNNDATARSFFESDLDVQRIVSSLALELDTRIDPEDTLIVLDEIQACPKAITSLKYFCEDARQYHVAAAGSLLGISATEGSGFPVGKVNMLELHPLAFSEFLEATGNERFGKLIESGDQAILDGFAKRLEELLKSYYVVGGMPEAVNAYVDDGDVRSVRPIQREILD